MMNNSSLRKVLNWTLGISLSALFVASTAAHVNNIAYALAEEPESARVEVSPYPTQMLTSEPVHFIVPEKNEDDEEEWVTVEGDLEEIKVEARGHADGERRISMGGSMLIPQCLPCAYYDIDYSTFYAFESIKQSWTYGSDSEVFLRNVYIDDLGLARRPVPEGQFGLYGDNNDDYVVALGSFYKTKHVCGERWLIITTTGAFTITTGDEQADRDTDRHNMFIVGGDGRAHLLEFIVEISKLPSSVRKSGTVTSAPITAFKGDIVSMLRIA